MADPIHPPGHIQEVPSGPRAIAGVETSIAAFVGFTGTGPTNNPVHISSFADYERTFGGLTADSALGYSVNQFFQNGGIEAYVVRVTDDNGTPPTTVAAYGDPLMKTGFYSLDNIDIFNMLCFPAVADSPTIRTQVYRDAIEYCHRRRAMMIVDLPADVQTPSDAQAWMNGEGSALLDTHVVAYFPRIMASDVAENGAVRSFPSSGAMGGIWARIDRLRGVWKAPAGTEASVVDVTGLASTINDQENGVLNPLGLNCLRTFPGQGAVVWGARTMDRFADEFKYIPVRRLALYLEGSIYSGTHWAVFEPNNDQLWTQIRVAVSAFMNSLFVQGAFVGQTPNDAYFVKCDHETTTQVDLEQGIVNIVIGFAPTYPAEFVVITIQQNAAAPSNPPK